MQPVIVVDADIEFLKSLKEDPRARSVPPVTVENGRHAQLALADTTKSYSGIFVNPNIESPYGISVLRFAHLHRPGVPVYLIHEPNSQPFSDLELRGLTIQRTIPKPLSYTQLVELVGPVAMGFDAAAALAEGAKNSDSLDTEVGAEDREFLPINAENFLAGSKCFFDVYVRLGSGRYLLILRAGDAFDPNRVLHYLKRGVRSFHLKRETQEHYLGYCDHLATALLKNPKIPTQVKASQTLNHGEEAMSFLRAHGLSEARLRHAQRFAANVVELANQLDASVPEIRGLLSDLENHEHGVATSMIASLLLHAIDAEAHRSPQILGLAALLHDVGLQRVLPELRHEDETKMTLSQRALYRTHPKIGAEILRGLRGVDSAVAQAVAQHHERRNKRGFPGQVGIGAINRVGELVGISDELSHAIVRARQSGRGPLEELGRGALDGFSSPVVEALKKLFS